MGVEWALPWQFFRVLGLKSLASTVAHGQMQVFRCLLMISTKLVFLVLVVGLMICGPVLALEILPAGPPSQLVAQTPGHGFSFKDLRLSWWDLKTKRLLKVLSEPVCLHPYLGPDESGRSGWRISYQQVGDELVSWCEGDDVLSQWHIPTGALVRRAELKGLAPLVQERFPGYGLAPSWLSEDGYALLIQRRELIRLFDTEGRLLKELEPESQVSRLWMNGQYLAGVSDASIQLWRLPHLEPTQSIKLSQREQVLGLTKQKLVTRLEQPLCNELQQSVPLGTSLDCRHDDEPRDVVLRYWDLETGRLANQQLIRGARDFGLSSDYVWALFSDQLKLFDDQGRTLKSLSLVGMNKALLKDRYGLAWSDVLMCSLDLQHLSRPACRPLNRRPSEVVLTDRFVYANHGQADDGYDWSRWRTYSMPAIEDLGAPQNLVGSFSDSGVVSNPAPTLIFQSGFNWVQDQNPTLFEFEGVKVTRSFSPFNSWVYHTTRHGQFIAVKGVDASLVVYQLATGQFLPRLPEQEGVPAWVSVSEGRLITILDEPLQPMIRIYDLPGLHLTAELEGHGTLIEGAAVFGDMLLTADAQELRLWDLRQARLMDRLKLQSCAPRDILYQAPRLVYQCEGQELAYDDNGRGLIRRDTGHHQLLLLSIDQGRFRLLDSYSSQDYIGPLSGWDGDVLTASYGNHFGLQNNQIRQLGKKPEVYTSQRILGTWPEILIQEQHGDDSTLRIFSSLLDNTRAKVMPDRLSIDWNDEVRLLAAPNRLIKLNPRGPDTVPIGFSQHLDSGILEPYTLSGREFPLDRSRGDEEMLWYRSGTWELRLDNADIIAKNRELSIENRFLSPGPVEEYPTNPTAWLEGDDGFVVDWRQVGVIQRCHFQGDCTKVQRLPEFMGVLHKIGNRLLGFAGPPDFMQQLLGHHKLWIWDAESLEVLRVIPMTSYTQLVEVSPPGTVTLFHPNYSESGFNQHQILNLVDGQILATYYSLLKPQGLLIVTESGYYAGVGDYHELVDLVDGEHELDLKDFPDFHRPDLVWQVLQGKPLDKLSTMPGLHWEERQ